MDFDRCRDILLREGELVGEIGALQDAVHAAVTGRDWEGFEGRFAELEEKGRGLEALEAEREALIPGAADGFYAFAASLPDDRRREISEAYRGLKIAAVRVKTAGDTLMAYIASQRATMAGFFDAAFPERSAKTYSPAGTQVSDDMRSMVLNRHF